MFFYKKHKKVLKTRGIIVSFLVAAVCCSLSSLLPVENLFITFSSPQTVFNYSVMGDINTVVEGEKSALILYTNEGARSRSIIPKSKTGWKIKIYSTNEETFSKTWLDSDEKIYRMSVYWCKHTNDYYIIISKLFTDDPVNIVDNRNSLFQKSKSSIDSSITYYAYVNDIDQNYKLTVDGKSIHIDTK